MAIEAAHVQFKYSKIRKEEVEVSWLYDDDSFLLLDEDPDEWILSANLADCLKVLTLELNLLNSRVEKIYSVSKLRNLRRLLLRHCDHLQELPANLGDLGRLTHLSLEYCGSIKSLPNSIGKLSNLTSLHLIFCHYLKELPASLGELSNLSLLDIQYSQIKWLPWSIAELSKLRVLLLPTNFSLQTLPGHLNDSVAICQNYNVRKSWAELKTEISLFSIPIVGAEAPQFPSTPRSPGYVAYEGDPRPWIHVKGLHSLVRILDLNLRHCWCKESISDFIVDLPMLTHLYISWGCLSHLAVKLTKITHLSLFECKFQCHIESCFDSLAKLSTLQSLEVRECEYLPTHMDLPVSLTHFTLQAYLSQKPLPDSYVSSIKRLSNLKSLALLGYAHVDLSLLNVNLVKLKLWNCSIKSLPASLQQLEIIHSKHLCENFSDYDDELQLWLNNLVSLQTLSLTCRHIQSLPSIEGLLNLHQFHLKDCFNLRKFPPNMDKLVNLHSINVSGTRIKSLRHSPTILQNLQLLILPKCFTFKSLSQNFMKKVIVIEDNTDDLYYEHEGYYDSLYDSSEDRELTLDFMEEDDEVVSQESEKDIINQQASLDTPMNSIPNATQVHQGCLCSVATDPIDNSSISHNHEMDILCALSEELGVPLAHDTSNEHDLVNEQRKTKKKLITRERIEELMSQNMRLVDAAEQLGVSRSTLKRKLKEYNITWGTEKKRKQHQEAKIKKQNNKTPSGVNFLVPDHLPCESNAVHNSVPDATRSIVEEPSLEAQCLVFHEQVEEHLNNAQECALSNIVQRANESCSIFVVKATYNEDAVRFDFSTSYGIKQLKEEVGTRLELEAGKFKIKYLDEDNEWMLMTTVSDLEHALRLSKSSGSNVVRLQVNLKT